MTTTGAATETAFDRDKRALLEALAEACESVRLGAILAQGQDLAARCGSGASAGDLDAAADAISRMDLDDIAGLIRVGAARFHLLNKAEQLNIVRVNRRREVASVDGPARAESIDQALETLAGRGMDARGVRAVLDKVDIGPTLTAHPTEARRRTVLDKQADVAASVLRLSRDDLTPGEREETLGRLQRVISLLLTTDEVRQQRLDVPAEVRNGLYFIRTTIWKAVPRLVRDVAAAARRTYGHEQQEIVANDLPTLIRYRSWIGGDRDGNPNVTADVTARTLGLMRETARELWDAELSRLHDALSVSSEALGADAVPAHEPGDDSSREPIRARIEAMRSGLQSSDDACSQWLLEGLLDIRRALLDSGLAGLRRVAEEGLLADAIARARAFGMHLATLDIRQHASVHARAVGELLGLAGVEGSYEELEEEGKLAVLRQELETSRPLVRDHARLSSPSAELMATLAVVRDAVARDPHSVRCWVISMTSHLSDLLAMVLLMREAGVAIQIVPLFETVDDLANAPALMDLALAEPAFRSHIEATSGERPEQEVMLGYSDSNKDGGFMAANVALHVAQQRIAEVFQQHKVELRYFHGRGGTIGRGGGRAGRAILSTPPSARSGRLRFTEQGEIITFRYAMPGMARRHLEQIVHASILAQAHRPDEGDTAPAFELLGRIAAQSRDAYRQLIDHPKFWDWFVQATPVEHIGGLPIASRPVSRATGARLRFENLRAIPWGFSWIQMRAIVPGWYGLGAVLSELDADERAGIGHAVEAGSFLSAVLENAKQEMARARLAVFRRYALAAEHGQEMLGLVESEFERCKAALAEITGSTDLMQHSPVVGQLIAERNPWTDVLNLAQLELLQRYRGGEPSQPERIRPVLHASINAIAAAMQSTG
jgi:phosphoenolpyruvate carboxylase